MCGICGFAGFDDDGLLARMSATLAHRGPDDEGRFDGPGVHLAHRRLSIIDVAGGHQPLHSRDGTRVLVLNGEIYNHRELRAGLEARGRVFATGSDTEVLLQLLEEKGPEALHDLDGMFAFALHDRRTGEVFLARDRLGIKPLDYLQRPGQLLFASGTRALVQAAGLGASDLSPRALRDYLALRYVPGGSLFPAVKSLPPGHHLTWRAGTARVRRWWSPPAAGEPEDRSDAEWIAGFGALMDRGVRRMLAGEVPFGAYLSGGIDSGVLAALMARHAAGPVSTFTVGFGTPGDETAQAADLARRLGCRHHEVRCDGGHADLLPHIVRHLDEPMGDPIVIPTWLLAREAGAQVKYVLAGDGADEILAGYLFHRVLWAGHRYAGLVPAVVRDRLVRPAVAACPPALLDLLFDYPADLGARGKQKFLDYLALVQPDRAAGAWRHLVSLFDGRDLGGLLDPAFAARLADEEAARPAAAEVPAPGPFLDTVLGLQYEHWLPDNMLYRADRLSMAHGVEVRVPYLAHELVEYCARLPRHLKLRGWTGKRILRAWGRTLLPAAAARRPKRAFHAPLDVFLARGPLRALLHDLLDESSVRRRGLFRPEAVRQRLDGLGRGEFVLDRQAFSLGILELWMRMHLDRPGA